MIQKKKAHLLSEKEKRQITGGGLCYCYNNETFLGSLFMCNKTNCETWCFKTIKGDRIEFYE